MFAAGLLLGLRMPAEAAGAGDGHAFRPNAFVHVGTDDVVTVVVGKSEMGQGVSTSLPMIVADEMEADFSKVRWEQAPADPAFIMPGQHLQITGGSTSVRTSFEALRQAGAAARTMLVAAAAASWGVPVEQCRAEQSTVVCGDRKATFGALATLAAQQPVPEHPTLKSASAFKLIGHPLPRLDVVDKVCGRAEFGLDVKVPGMLYAAVLRSPTFGGRVRRVDDSAARARPGVRRIVTVSDGVAVVAESWWQARQAREKLKVTWDEGPHASLSTPDIWHQYRTAAAQQEGVVAAKSGSSAGIKPDHVLSAEYRLPFLAHATMEPMNCTADVRADGADVWTGTQAQTLAVGTVARITGLPPAAIRIHTTLLGGGFGRRAEQDFIAEAVELSKAMGAPVKVVFTREDDMQHDYYRPLCLHQVQGELAGGRISKWRHRIVTQSILNRFFPGSVKDGSVDPTSVEGGANQPYDVGELHVDCITLDPGVPVGFWRSVGASHNAFAVESFVDELAHAAGVDPFHFRQRLLSHSPRHRHVLEVAAEKAGWGRPLPAGWGRGIAVAESFDSYVAQVVELEAVHGSAPRIHRVVVAVDCGPIVNPDTVVAQMEGGMVYGLSAALYGQITLSKGQVEQSNFNDYPVLRMSEMPRHVEVHLVPTGEKQGGVGEPGVPPIAPAVTNALFAATGRRVRALPIAPV
jgi:isoquinoline 1-oxidoreductase beta subunit